MVQKTYHYNIKKNKIMIKKIYNQTLKTLACFTLAKFGAAVFTILIVASIKYIISGGFYIGYDEFFNNVAIGLLGWTLNTGFIGWFTEYLGLKGINFNLNQLVFGFDTMGGDKISSVEDSKPKLYNAMESEGSNTGKGVQNRGGRDRKDPRVHPYPRDGRRLVRSWVFDDDSGSDTDTIKAKSENDSGSDTETESEEKKKVKSSLKGKKIAPSMNDHLNKGKGIVPNNNDTLDKGKEIAPVYEPPFAIWNRVFPGVDPTVFYPPRINPGPGFNVPGGEVPIRDDICKHIDYNSHILKQFKTMDLETAIQQRNGYLLFIQVTNDKIAFAQNALAKVPTIPRTEHEFKIRNVILRDLESFNRDNVRSEAKATLLNSRIQFIESKINNNNNNN
jgi:hypothetical protein